METYNIHNTINWGTEWNRFCAASAGSNLYVAETSPVGGYYIYRYDTEGNMWEKQPHSCTHAVKLTIYVL